MIIHNSHSNLIRLQNNPVKEYAWGCSNQQCYVARLTGKTSLNNYAELWMGVHCNGESQIRTTLLEGPKTIKLSQFLQNNHLPSLEFLFKVLSIEKCLSIQVHPSKNQAQILHKNQPQIYLDDNDKPEMFYTLSQFQCFFGYVPKQEFDRLIGLGLFKEIFGQSPPKDPRQAILQILKLDKQKQQELIQFSITKLSQIHPTRYQESQPNRKIWKILQDFPNDIGIVVSFFLNYRIFPPGICCYIESNTPHAYISGECLEIMKNSDNVCRLGLTPKYKDLDVIGEVLGSNFCQIFPTEGKKQIQNSYTSHIYSQRGLNLQIISRNSIKLNQPNHFSVSPCGTQRILLILAGQFQIKSGKQQNYEVVSMGTVLLLLADTQYQLSQKEGEGLLCLGWSEF